MKNGKQLPGARLCNGRTLGCRGESTSGFSLVLQMGAEKRMFRKLKNSKDTNMKEPEGEM